jgi:hypothetical protein
MKIKFIIAAIALFSCASFAQELLTNLSWSLGLPANRTEEYIQDLSYRGFNISGRRFIDKYNSVGFATGWNIFDQKVTDPLNIVNDAGTGSGTITGTQIRTINSFPLLVGFHHHFGRSDDMRLFIGLNAGTYYILQRLEMGVFLIDDDNWHFGLAPEGGIIIPVGDDGTGIQLNARLNYAFDSGTGLGGETNNYYTFWDFGIGFSFSSTWF